MDHTHAFPARLTAGCPACAPAINARNLAIGHLSEAIDLLAGLQNPDEPKTVHLSLAPVHLTDPDTVHLCHGWEITPKLAESLADAVDSMNAWLDSASDQVLGNAMEQAAAGIPVDKDSLNRRKAGFEGWLEGQAGEVIESGDYSAAAVAQCYPDLYADVTDVFMLLDPREITKTVLDDRQVDLLYAVQALDDVYGDVHDPYADEDGDL